MPSEKQDGADPSKPPCKEAISSMYRFLDKELETGDFTDVKSHLDDCIPCLEAFEFEAELKMLIATKCRDEVPAALYERIRISIKSAHTNGDAPPPSA